MKTSARFHLILLKDQDVRSEQIQVKTRIVQSEEDFHAGLLDVRHNEEIENKVGEKGERRSLKKEGERSLLNRKELVTRDC